MLKIKITHIIWPPILLYTLFLLSKLAGFDSLSSFANDSIHYLAMARHYSPWINESDAIASVWLQQDFPPFFPWVLAITGAAHSLIYAHLLVVALGISSVFFLYRLALRWLKSEALAIFSIAIILLTPGFVLGLQGILSESLYLLLTLIFFWSYLKQEENSSSKTRHTLLLILLITSIILTRSIGVTISIALFTYAVFTSINKKDIQYRDFFTAVAPVILYMIIMAVWGPVKQSHYGPLLLAYLFGDGVSATGTGLTYKFSFSSHFSTMLYSWKSYWIMFSPSGFSLSHISIQVLIVTSVAGLLIRIVKNKIDAWYVLFYSSILFIWPLSGQMYRLIFPIMPLFLIYAGYALLQLSKYDFSKKQTRYGPAILYAFVVAAIIPSHIFIHSRLNMAINRGMIPVYEIFSDSGEEYTQKILVVQNQMLKDFKHIEDTTLPEDKVMYYLPSYIAVLSNRVGIRSYSPVNEEQYIEIAKKNNAEYILLTRLHPRNSSLLYSGFLGKDEIRAWTSLAWCSQIKGVDISSCLFKVSNIPNEK